MQLGDPVGAEAHARNALKFDRAAPMANYIMGSLAMVKGEINSAESYLKRAADADKSVVYAINDLAELYRRTSRLDKALEYAERAVVNDPTLDVAHETLASILLELRRDLPRAKKELEKAIELSSANGAKVDVRMLVTLVKLQSVNGEVKEAKQTLRTIQSRINELPEHDLKEYEELLKSVK